MRSTVSSGNDAAQDPRRELEVVEQRLAELARQHDLPCPAPSANATRAAAALVVIVLFAVLRAAADEGSRTPRTRAKVAL